MPLNAMCSSRCEMPCSLGFSSRPPTPAQTPSAAVSRWGILSVTTVRPDGKLGNLDAHPATPCFAARLTDSTNRSTSAWSFFITFMCSDLVIRPSSQAGSCGRMAAGGFDRIGEFGRMGGGQHDAGHRRVVVSRSATASATAVWGSTSSPASRQAARIAAAVSVSSARPASNPRGSRPASHPAARSGRTASANPSAGARRRHRARRPRTAAARNSRRPGCPSTATPSRGPRAPRRSRSSACAPGCR